MNSVFKIHSLLYIKKAKEFSLFAFLMKALPINVCTIVAVTVLVQGQQTWQTDGLKKAGFVFLLLKLTNRYNVNAPIWKEQVVFFLINSLNVVE